MHETLSGPGDRNTQDVESSNEFVGLDMVRSFTGWWLLQSVVLRFAKDQS
jgi:hypothetical protein